MKISKKISKLKMIKLIKGKARAEQGPIPAARVEEDKTKYNRKKKHKTPLDNE